MNPNESKTTYLINEIEKFDQHSAQRLRELDQPLQDNTAIVWAEADIYQLINPNLLVQEYRQSLSVGSRLGWIQALRNVFILLPVMVTWLGIAWAVSGYHALLQEAPDLSSQPFLLLWQGGFEGQMWLTFERLGYIDFGLLFLVVLLTFIDQFSLLSSRSDQTEAKVRHFRSELSHFLAYKSRQLNQRKQEFLFRRQEYFVKMIQESITKTQQPLTQLAEEFKGVVEEFKGVLESIKGEHERLKELTTERTREIDDFRIFSKGLANGAGEIREAILALQSIYQALNQSMEAFPNSLLKVESKQSEIVISLQNTMQEFKRLIEVQHDLSSQWKQISEMGNTSNERLEQIIGVQKNWGQSLIEVQNKWQQSLDEQKKWEQNLSQAHENWGQKLVQAQENWAQSLIEVQEKWQQSLDNQNKWQQNLIQEQNNSGEKLVQAQENWAQSLIEVQEKWQQSFDEQKKWQQNLSQEQKNSGEKLVQAQENAQQDLREGVEQLGEQLNDSLNHLTQTLLHLSTQSNSTLSQFQKNAQQDLREGVEQLGEQLNDSLNHLTQTLLHLSAQSNPTLVQAESDSVADAEEAEPDLPTEIAEQKSTGALEGEEQIYLGNVSQIPESR